MRFSIAMCTYDGARYLKEQLGSFITQQRRPDELVVCDDGSTDQSLGILDRFAREAPFPVHVFRNQNNLGYSRNFAQAVNLCNGDLIALSDQDDIWYPHKLARLEMYMTKHPTAQAIFSDGELIDSESRLVGRTLWESFRFGAGNLANFRSGAAVDELLRRNVVTGMTFAMRSSSRHLLRDTPSSWIHDGWIAFLLAMRNELLACPERLVAYRVHDEQQVGAPPSHLTKLHDVKHQGFRLYAENVRRMNLVEYQRTSRQYSDLLAYLQREGLGVGVVQNHVKAKQQHAARGAAALSKGRFSRLLPVLSNVLSYARYSPNGLRGIARDVLT